MAHPFGVMRALLNLLLCRGERMMAAATLTFRRCIVNSPEYGGDEKHLGSRVYFDLDVEGQEHPNLYADIRQPIGFGSEAEFVEVTEPYGYAGPLNVPVFQGLVEFYYRHVIGAQGMMFGTQATDMRFVGYVLEKEMRVQFEVS